MGSSRGIEFRRSSHDPKLLSMSYDTGIAEVLLVARRLKGGEHPSGRGRFVNLWRAPYQETDALALVRGVKAVASSPLLQSDGPPVGGNPLFIGGKPWGEVVNGPVGEEPWTAARWKRVLTGQFALAIERGELWADDGVQLVGHFPVTAMAEICNVGPEHRSIRGSHGAFEAYHGYNEHAQLQAIWRQSASVHQSMVAEPNAWLIPKPGIDYQSIWSQAGALHFTGDIRYNSQRIMAMCTNIRALGVRAWFTLAVQETNPMVRPLREIALALWCNSTLGMLLHASHSNRAQAGRGTGNKRMLSTMSTLDVRKLEAWQLDEVQAIWRMTSETANSNPSTVRRRPGPHRP